ncbi:MAG: carboxypeptidase regulatory-like domain-containing protein [Ignavibacteriales bacterium]|nr:carboxypeptidase regulatory-like domain-containing protein [Ignavibacteriales bacterium]
MKKLTTYFVLIMSLIVISYSVNAQSVLPPPANLTVEQQGAIAKLTWNSAQGASWYKIYKSVDSLPYVLLATIHQTNYSDPSVSYEKIYKYYVTASNYIGESLPSNDVIFKLDAQPPSPIRGFIKGKIVDDSSGFSICGVRLRFYKPDGFLYFREARTDSLGDYSIHIDTGSYYIYASKWTYQSEWFDNVADRENATLVHVAHKDTSIADFGLKKIVPALPPRLVSISGTVTDSITGNPIKDAFVVIMRSTRQINLIQNQEGHLFGNRNETFMIPGFGTLIGVMRVVRTTDEGSYTAWVPDSLNYIMLSFKLGYVPEFYNNKLTPYDADRIFAASNMTGLNFDLVSNPDAQNSVSGQVKSLAGEGVFSKVVLFEKTPIGIFPLRCGITDTNGNYSFGYLYSGYYYTKAYPYSAFAPAWYSADSCGIGCWVNADSFLVDGNTTGADICVQPITITGFACISGSVNESGSGTEIQGATVYAVSPLSNTIIGYDITEQDGSFEIQNLPPGLYQMVVDKEGYTANEFTVYSVDAVNNFRVTEADISISNFTLEVPGTDNNMPVNYRLSQNYPNPFNPVTNIEFSIANSQLTILKVFDMLGREVVTLVNEVKQSGVYTLNWDASVYPSGVYYYRLQSGGFMETKKLILMK